MRMGPSPNPTIETLEGRALLAAAGAPAPQALRDLTGITFSGTAAKSAVVVSFTDVGTDGRLSGDLTAGSGARQRDAVFAGRVDALEVRLTVTDENGRKGKFAGHLDADGRLIGRFRGGANFLIGGGRRGFVAARLVPTQDLRPGRDDIGFIGSIAGGTLGRVNVGLTAGGLGLTANGGTSALGDIGTTTGAIGGLGAMGGLGSVGLGGGGLFAI